ncbi:3-isopropylmalate dehydrogenase [Puccinia triticina 1-1 BBBD Race 1]|uniref:3-isopropylmalate dehydrogenase n=1 Tax=Puccinia triticina (isolate 1-1 / race 1 (BBBD)) TaxID=630390 RepID=A0A0C4EXV9_PUCT1|nr:3-isopropylmalate dehydrogenase [Puccinia triticina 1-1 BBBD Race 1]
MATTYKIVTLPGDGIGPEVIEQASRVLDVISQSGEVSFEVQACDFGGIAIDNHGTPLPASTLQACQAADAILLGSVGGPKWGVGKVRPEQGLLELRKTLGLYANIRPALFPSESLVQLSPLKDSIASGTEIIVVRELIGGIYFGQRTEASSFEADGGEASIARDECSYSVAEIQRIARVAAFLAMTSTPPMAVHSVDKANVLATSRLWRKVVTDLFAKEFPQLSLDHHLVDSAAMLICSNPKKLNGIVLTENLFGDVLSDETSVIPGSLGLLPSASLAGIPDRKSKCLGVYEPIHGSAPDIAGQGIANPVGTILSVALMLRYSLGLDRQAEQIELAVRKVLDSQETGGRGLRTADLKGHASTKQLGDAVVSALKTILSS